MVKNLPANAEDMGSIPGSGISPGGGYGNPLQYSCLENPHEQRSLVGDNPQGHRELDTTERLSTRARAHTHTRTHTRFSELTFPVVLKIKGM